MRARERSGRAGGASARGRRARGGSERGGSERGGSERGGASAGGASAGGASAGGASAGGAIARGERARGGSERAGGASARGERLICLARYCPQVKLIESKKTNYKASAEESASGISLICGLIQSTQRNQILENGNFRVTEN